MSTMSKSCLMLLALLVASSSAFTVAPRNAVHFTSRLFSSEPSTAEDEKSTSSTPPQLLSLTLEKPLGMILEEVEEGAPKGVFVLELAEEGSAAAAPEASDIIGSKLTTVMGDDVTTISFDEVMEKIINAPSPVELQLQVSDNNASEEAVDEWPVGTPVAVTVQREGEPDLVINTKVGDNLRKTLIENEVEVYRGFKAKVGNCGGGGQCGFCAVEFIDSQGWEPRSDYEDKKIKRSPNSRLSCLNNIQGPVTIKM